MAKKTTLAAGTSPFAHLLGGAAALAGRALGNRAEQDNDDPDAEEEGDDPDAEDEDADEPEGKKAATPYQRGYAAANKRAAAIFTSPAAAGRPDLAAQLAFGTSMSSAEAIGVLSLANTGKGQARSRLDDRMAGRRDARPGAGTGATGGDASFADKVAAANKKAGR